jgi:hypothetical protein
MGARGGRYILLQGLSEELHRAVRAARAYEGVTTTQWVVDAIVEKLARAPRGVHAPAPAADAGMETGEPAV